MNSVLTLEWLAPFSLAPGYMWDAELSAVGKATPAFRNGKDNAIWAIQLRRDAGSATGFTWIPVAPDLPEMDLWGVIREAEKESGT